MRTGYVAGALCSIIGLMSSLTLYSEVKGDLSPALNVSVKENRDSVDSAPGIHFDNDVVDFGEIDNDSIRSHSFLMTNNGTAPLVITRVYSGCGCTYASYPKEPVMPGDTARVVVKFNPAGRPAGYFTKLVRIRTNATPLPYRLYIKGKIVGK